MERFREMAALVDGAFSAGATVKQAFKVASVVARTRYGIADQEAGELAKQATAYRWDGGIVPGGPVPQGAKVLPYGTVVRPDAAELYKIKAPALDASHASSRRNQMAMGGAGLGLTAAALYTALSKAPVDEKGKVKRKPWLRNLFLGAAIPAAAPYVANFAKHTALPYIKDKWNETAKVASTGPEFLFDAAEEHIEALPESEKAAAWGAFFDEVEKVAVLTEQAGGAVVGASLGALLARLNDPGYDEEGNKRPRPYLQNTVLGGAAGFFAPQVTGLFKPAVPRPQA